MMEALFQEDLEAPGPEETIAEATQFTPEYLVFKVGEIRCALPVLQIKEVAEEISITPVPNVPTSIAGVVNLRGSVLPVLDLKRILGVREALRAQQVLVLRKEPPVGLLIEGTLQISPFLRTTVKPLLQQEKEDYRGMALFRIEAEGSPPLVVLDADLLIEFERIFPS